MDYTNEIIVTHLREGSIENKRGYETKVYINRGKVRVREFYN